MKIIILQVKLLMAFMTNTSLQFIFTAVAISLPIPSGVFFPVFVIGESNLSSN